MLQGMRQHQAAHSLHGQAPIGFLKPVLTNSLAARTATATIPRGSWMGWEPPWKSFHEKAVIVKQRLAALAAIKVTSSAVLPSAL